MSFVKGWAHYCEHMMAEVGFRRGDVTIKLKMTIEGDGIAVDFTGSSPQVKAGINSVLTFTKSATYGAIRMVIDPDIPNSAGCYRPIEIIAPEGSVVNPRLPGAVGARGVLGFKTEVLQLCTAP